MAKTLAIIALALSLLMLAPTAVAAESTVDAEVSNGCSGTVAVGCTDARNTPAGSFCILYVDPNGGSDGACVIWITP